MTTLSLKQTDKAYPSCLASIAINDQCLTVLVDTGASKSVLDLRAWQRVSAPSARMTAADLALFGANGTPLSMYGAVDLTFDIQGCKYNQRFQVVDIRHQSVSGILGLNFLIAMAAKIDLGNMTLTMGKQPVPGLVGKQSTVYAVMLKEDLECDGYTANLARCNVCQGESLGDHPLVFESMLSDELGISLPEVVVKQNQGIINIRVAIASENNYA